MVGLGLNDCGEVTGFVELDHTACDGHPSYYSYLGNSHGIPPQTTRDLSVLAAQPTWYGKAHDINNESDPLMVGSTDVPLGASYAAFRSRVSAAGTITNLPLAPSDSKSSAFDVSTPNSGPPLAVGGSIGFTPFPNPPCGHLHVDEAIAWTIGTSTTVSQLVEDSANPSDMSYWQAVANAVNSDGDQAGWRRQNSDCRKRALAWVGGTPVDLGFLSPIPTSSDTEVRGMTAADSSGALALVGTDALNAEGYLWWRPSSSSLFTAIPASGLCLALPPGLGFSKIIEFNDVNRWGWIVGTAQMTNAPFKQAVLLIPDHCPADLDWNGITDATDLSILLGAWGTCPGTTSCVADLDCDNNVGATDLAILLGAWNSACTYFEDLAGR